MTSIQRIYAVMLLALLPGCANQIKIRSNYDPTVKFAGWKTFTWAPGTHTGLADPRLNAAFIDPQVRADVKQELTAKGFVLGAADTADFLVSYHVTMDDKISRNQVTDGPLYSAVAVSYQDGTTTATVYQDPMTVSYVDVYRVGTLAIRIASRQPQRIVWQGAAQARLLEDVPLATRQERLKKSIHRILENFPPK